MLFSVVDCLVVLCCSQLLLVVVACCLLSFFLSQSGTERTVQVEVWISEIQEDTRKFSLTMVEGLTGGDVVLGELDWLCFLFFPF